MCKATVCQLTSLTAMDGAHKRLVVVGVRVDIFHNRIASSDGSPLRVVLADDRHTVSLSPAVATSSSSSAYVEFRANELHHAAPFGCVHVQQGGVVRLRARPEDEDQPDEMLDVESPLRVELHDSAELLLCAGCVVDTLTIVTDSPAAHVGGPALRAHVAELDLSGATRCLVDGLWVRDVLRLPAQRDPQLQLDLALHHDTRVHGDAGPTQAGLHRMAAPVRPPGPLVFQFHIGNDGDEAQAILAILMGILSGDAAPFRMVAVDDASHPQPTQLLLNCLAEWVQRTHELARLRHGTVLEQDLDAQTLLKEAHPLLVPRVDATLVAQHVAQHRDALYGAGIVAVQPLCLQRPPHSERVCAVCQDAPVAMRVCRQCADGFYCEQCFSRQLLLTAAPAYQQCAVCRAPFEYAVEWLL